MTKTMRGTSYASILSANGYPGYSETFAIRVFNRMANYDETMAIAVAMLGGLG